MRKTKRIVAYVPSDAGNSNLCSFGWTYSQGIARCTDPVQEGIQNTVVFRRFVVFSQMDTNMR